MGDMKLGIFALVALGGVIGFGVGALSVNGTADIVVDGRINPNTASLGMLAELPSIGPSRAGAIVEYRQRVASDGGGRAFSEIGDLEKVKGIGAITAQKLKVFLTFE